MSEVLWNLMEILYKRGHVEYLDSLNANFLKEYNLEVPCLRPAWASLKYFEASNFCFPTRMCKMTKHFESS